MIDLEGLKKFLAQANMPHATGKADMRKEKNGSRTIVFSDGDWSMEDNFFGGEPYGGQQVVLYKDEPVWICVYYGRVQDTVLTADHVYGFLREALQYPPEDRPFRGPDSYTKGNLEYRNMFEGEAGDYSGKEVILDNGKQVYWAKYMGGLVDQRFKGSL
jgi:hypothetical protein